MPASRVFATLIAVSMLATACAPEKEATDAPVATSATPTASPTVSSTMSTPVTTTTTAAADYRATSASVDETRGSNTVRVALPQIAGGSAAVRDRFNSGMRTALDELVGPDSDTTIENGSLIGDERSRVTALGPHVVGGVAIFNSYTKGAAHPYNSVATIVIDADTAQPIMLDSLWTDRQAAAERLSALVTQIDDRVEPINPPVLDTFVNWVPTPRGLHVYVSAAHVLGDYLPVTVPWDKISDLMTPRMRAALAG